MKLRLGSASVAYAISEHRDPSEDWEGWCLVFVRTCLGVDRKYPSAASAYSHTTRRHGTAGQPPAGVPIWWTGHQFGHVALSAGGGYCWSNDILRVGKIDKVAISTITRGWGMTYKGWTEDINGVRVYTAPASTTQRVHMSALQDAARRDPAAAQGKATHRADVTIVERALVAEGLLDDRWLDGAWGTKTSTAWARYQRRRGDTSPNGVPGRVGMEALGRKYKFEVLD